jgi:hypothetical protein
MSLRRSTRQSIALAAKKNKASPSPSSTTRKRANGEKDSRQTNTKRVKKASPDDAPATDPAAFKVPQVPVTPGRKRSAKAMKAPPLTPTPSLVGLMRTPLSSGDIDGATPPPSKLTILFLSPVNLIVLWFLPASCDTRRISASSPAFLHFGFSPARPLYQGVTLTISWQMTVQLNLTRRTPLW